MSTNGTATAQTATATDPMPTVATDEIGAAGTPEQLSLLAPCGVPLQFRLDERTRRCGLAHVAALRAQIAAQAAARNLSPEATCTPARQKPARQKPGRQIAA